MQRQRQRRRRRQSEAYCNLDSSYNNSKVLRSMPTEQQEQEDAEQMKLLIIHSNRCCI